MYSFGVVGALLLAYKSLGMAAVQLQWSMNSVLLATAVGTLVFQESITRRLPALGGLLLAFWNS